MVFGWLAVIHAELLNIFQRDWLPGIVLAATKLAQVGILDWEGFIELMAQGQRNAHLAGSLNKALTLENNLLALKNCIRIDPFESLQKSLAQADRANRFERVGRLHKAISQPGISAHEVARREAMRNLADQRARLAGGK